MRNRPSLRNGRGRWTASGLSAKELVSSSKVALSPVPPLCRRFTRKATSEASSSSRSMKFTTTSSRRETNSRSSPAWMCAVRSRLMPLGSTPRRLKKPTSSLSKLASTALARRPVTSGKPLPMETLIILSSASNQSICTRRESSLSAASRSSRRSLASPLPRSTCCTRLLISAICPAS